MNTLRIASIGTCGRGALADRYLTPEDHVEIVAGADISTGQLDRFRIRVKEHLGTAPATYLDYREMLDKERLDGVFVTSPDDCHEEQAVCALEHGLAVYLEKPMAITIEGADRVLRAARDNRAGLMLGHNMRYMSFVLKMKEIIDSGAIGAVKAIWCRHFISYGGDAYFRDWHAERKRANSLLLQKGAHRELRRSLRGDDDRAVGRPQDRLVSPARRRHVPHAADERRAWRIRSRDRACLLRHAAGRAETRLIATGGPLQRGDRRAGRCVHSRGRHSTRRPALAG
jgi:predicted dehydrogenase